MSKIDVHHHIYPPQFTEALNAVDGDPSGWPTPVWTLEADDALCASLGVSTTIFSVTAPGASVLKDCKDAARLARKLNQYCAHIHLCLEEISYALDILHADGIVLFTRYDEDNHYLGHADFKPTWKELNRRKAVVFIHPTHPVDTNLVNAHSPLLLYDYPHETTRTAMDLIMSNNLREFRECKIILSHAGGTLPYLVHRVALVADTPFSVHKTQEEIFEDAKRFYFDLALSGNGLILDTLLSFAKPGLVLFGSDYPNAPTTNIENLTKVIDQHYFDPDTKTSIMNGAALRLFPRLNQVYTEGLR